MEYVTLNNGFKMPKIGFGTMSCKGVEGEDTIALAIQNGYRMLDTAVVYGNEETVGNGIKKSGIDRKELIVVSKLWFDHNSYEEAKKGFYESLERLQLDYIDVYLLHYPFGDYMGAWRALEELYEEGKIKAIGVSNFFNDQLLNLMTFSKVKPVINQIQCSPFIQRDIEKAFLQDRGVAMEAWQSFAQGKNGIFQNELLAGIGKKYNKSIAQVILRWQTQQDIVAIPSSPTTDLMLQNLDIFDFKLADEDIALIKTMNTKEVLGTDEYRIHMLEKFL